MTQRMMLSSQVCKKLLSNLLDIDDVLGNKRLLDIGNLLLIQEVHDNGTLVANNDILCFNAPVEWSSHIDSLLEYYLDRVCILGNLCSSFLLLLYSFCLHFYSTYVIEVTLAKSTCCFFIFLSFYSYYYCNYDYYHYFYF